MRKFFLKSCVVILLTCALISSSWAGVLFDAVDDRITMEPFDNHAYDEMTIAVWYKSTNTSRGDDQVIYHHSDDVDDTILFGITDDGGYVDGLRFLTNNGGNVDNYRDTLDVVDQAWHHLAVVRTATRVKMYVDGSEVFDGADGEAGNTITVDDNNGEIGPRLGDEEPLATEQIDGTLDEFYFWDTDLSATEIAMLANSRVRRTGLQIQSSSLSIYLPLDDEEDGSSADGDTFLDMSGNGNTGTGVDGANDSGLTAKAGEVLTYP